MDDCVACKKPITDGQSITIVSDGLVFNDGEVDIQNTERYHSECIVVDW